MGCTEADRHPSGNIHGISRHISACPSIATACPSGCAGVSLFQPGVGRAAARRAPIQRAVLADGRKARMLPGQHRRTVHLASGTHPIHPGVSAAAGIGTITAERSQMTHSAVGGEKL